MAVNQVDFYPISLKKLIQRYPNYYIAESVLIAKKDIPFLIDFNEENLSKKTIMKKADSFLHINYLENTESILWIGDDEKTDLSLNFKIKKFSSEYFLNSCFFRVDVEAKRGELSNYFDLFYEFELYLMTFPSQRNDFVIKAFQPNFKIIEKYLLETKEFYC